MDNQFIVPINGLKAGRTALEWRADGKFFGEFDNSEILDASLDIHTEIEKSGRFIGIDSSVNGYVVVSCDRCLSDLKIPVQTEIRLSVKFGDGDGSADEGDREIVMVPHDNAELDMSQIIYDYVCISVPVQKVHPEGECDPDVVRYLSFEEGDLTADAEPVESPFASLKEMLGNNNI